MRAAPRRRRPARADRLRTAVTVVVVAAVVLLARAGHAAQAPATATPDGRPAASFAYLHVEANEGNSSGGHVALRFGDDVYHFQHHAGGILRLRRDDAAAFRHRYARLENRTLHVREIAARPETVARLHRRFDERFLREERAEAVLAQLAAEHAVLQALASGAPARIDVRGAAFFAAAASDDGLSTRAAVTAVREQIRARDGTLLTLERRRDEVDGALAALRGWSGDPAGAAGPPVAGTTFAERGAELLAARRALDVLRDAPPLDARAVRATGTDEGALDDGEVAALTALAGALAERAAALAASRRPDWGSALLLTVARLAVVQQSIAARRLVVLDAYPADAVYLTPDEVAAQADLLPELLREAASDVARARRPLARGTLPREAEFTALESATNRLLELRAAAEHGAPLRLARGTLLPSGTATIALDAPPGDRAAWRDLADAAGARVAGAHAARRQERGYELLSRNCVSELFREIASTLAPSPDDAAALDCSGSDAELGGCVDPAARLRFIPFVSAAAVDDEYRVVARHEVPSHRAHALAALREQEPAIAVLLRESNVLTSTVYRANDDDSVFLFFTDDAVAVRPVLGGVNLATGLGAAAAGLVTLPVDDGTLLLRGLRGALFSLPELAFLSIRKGSFRWLPRESTPAAAADAAS